MLVFEGGGCLPAPPRSTTFGRVWPLPTSFADLSHHELLFATTTLHHPRTRACMLVSRVVDFCHDDHFHHPRKQACMLAFEGGSCLPVPPALAPAPTTLRHEHVSSFSRMVATTHYHPRTWVHMLVFEGDSCLPPPPAPPTTLDHKHVCLWLLFATTTLEHECACSFSRVVAVCDHHHLPPSDTSTYAHLVAILFRILLYTVINFKLIL